MHYIEWIPKYKVMRVARIDFPNTFASFDNTPRITTTTRATVANAKNNFLPNTVTTTELLILNCDNCDAISAILTLLIIQN